MTSSHPPRSFWLGPLLLALAAWTAVVLTLDGVGQYPALPDGPGLTVDEIFNISSGVEHWHALLDEGPLLWTPAGARRVFGRQGYNPDHPPLGRFAIGAAHDVGRMILPANVPKPTYSVFAARLAPASTFALTILLCGVVAGRWWGRGAGVAAAMSISLMPRLFAHAHFASLETFVNLTFVATVLYIGSRWCHTDSTAMNQQPQPGLPWRVVIIAGFLFGLTLLTKMQAVLLPIPIGLWALWQWRWRAVPMMLVFGTIGLAVFFLGWPWLWLDPNAHLRDYFARSTNRATLHCYYLGQTFNDRDVPWHYSYVIFLLTVPVGLHLFGFWGAIARRTSGSPSTNAANDQHSRINPRVLLLSITVLFPLTFFALPGLTVYDGSRLFLMVYPLWGMLAGRGAIVIYNWFTVRFNSRIATCLLAVFFAAQLPGSLLTHPCQLSYYNLLVGGPKGANSLGFESTYWRDSITRDLLVEVAERLPRGSTIYVAPVLHPTNLQDIEGLSPLLLEREITLDAYDNKDPAKVGRMKYILVFRRHADAWPALEPSANPGSIIAEVRREGVQLAVLYEQDTQ